MMMYGSRFLHISFSKPWNVPPKQLEPIFSNAQSWIRYTSNCWIVLTAESCNAWAERIRNAPGLENANVFVCEFIDYSGFLPDWCWQWMADHAPHFGIAPTRPNDGQELS